MIDAPRGPGGVEDENRGKADDAISLRKARLLGDVYFDQLNRPFEILLESVCRRLLRMDAWGAMRRAENEKPRPSADEALEDSGARFRCATRPRQDRHPCQFPGPEAEGHEEDGQAGTRRHAHQHPALPISCRPGPRSRLSALAPGKSPPAAFWRIPES